MNTTKQPTIYLEKMGDFYQIFASDGDFFDECIGSYNINRDIPIKFVNEKLSYWLMMGAIPTLEVINIIGAYFDETPLVNKAAKKMLDQGYSHNAIKNALGLSDRDLLNLQEVTI